MLVFTDATRTDDTLVPMSLQREAGELEEGEVAGGDGSAVLTAVSASAQGMRNVNVYVCH
jgi:hypothetical protein